MHTYPNFVVQSFCLGQLDTNCHFIWCRETLECIIIDPADEGTFICEEILARQLKPVAIVLTHGHFDHVLGTLEVMLAFNLPVYLNQADAELLAGAPASAKHWLGAVVDPVPTQTQQLSTGDRLSFGNCSLEVLETPGHTKGSVCLFAPDPEEPVLFTGDTIFEVGVGRTDFSYSNKTKLKQSLALLADYPDNTRCYAGHGADFTLATRLR